MKKKKKLTDEIEELMSEILKSKILQTTYAQMITRNEVSDWIRGKIWIAYSLDRICSKKLQIAVGMPGFRVLHGKEIIYEGSNLSDAVDAYNNITSRPNVNDSPKIDN